MWVTRGRLEMLIGPTEANERISNNEMPHKLDAETGRSLWFYCEEHLEHKAVPDYPSPGAKERAGQKGAY